MESESRSSRGLEKFTKILVSRARKIRSAIDRESLVCAVSLWHDYVVSEEFGFNHSESDPEAYRDVASSLKRWLFEYTKQQGFKPAQLYLD